MPENIHIFTESQWADLAGINGKGEEFDWLACDRDGHLAVFTSACAGTIPSLVWKHHTEYNRLATFLNSLPGHGFERVFHDSGNYSEWDELADLGLYAFDYHDVHRVLPRKGYDLISRPLTPLTCDLLPEELVAWLPVLDVQFSALAFVTNGIVLAAQTHAKVKTDVP